MAAMLDGRNNEIFLHENTYFFPEERICIVPAIHHGRHANINEIMCNWFHTRVTSTLTRWYTVHMLLFHMLYAKCLTKELLFHVNYINSSII